MIDEEVIPVVIPRPVWVELIVAQSEPDQRERHRLLLGHTDIEVSEQFLDDLDVVLSTASKPVCEITIEAHGSTLDGWVDGAFVVLTIPTEDDQIEITAAPTAYLPLVLTELVDLTPRHSDPRRMDAEVATDAFDELLAGAPGILDEVTGVPPVHWAVSVRWGPADSRTVEVLDTESQLWGVERLSDERTRLRATSPTQVFRELTALLPTDDELSSRSRPLTGPKR